MSPQARWATLLAAASLSLWLAPGCSGSSTVVDEAEGPPASAEVIPVAAPSVAPADGSAKAPDSAAPTSSAEPAGGAKKDAGAACDTAEDCASGTCEGEGCGAMRGQCAAADRRCTMDLRKYCGCDGKTFNGSGSCPRRRFAKKGPCDGDPGPGPNFPAPKAP